MNVVHMSALAVGMTMAAALAAETNPVKLAGSARLDLLAPAAIGELSDGQITSGRGSLTRPGWLPAPEQSRAYTVEFPILRFAANEVAVSFVPQQSGPVILWLMGPWEEASKGVIFRQEVLWEALHVTGALVAEPGWEKLTKPVSTWHNQRVNLTLNVTGKQPVTLALAARPFVPPDFADLKRITSRTTPAHLAAKKFLRGANLGNYLEAPPNANWGAKYSVEDFVQIRAEGFDHVRLPIAWHNYAGAGPEFKLAEEIFAKADFLVTNAINHGLNAIVNIHHFDEFTAHPAALTNKFYALWRQVAAHYAKSSDGVAFELLNEPKDAATTLVLNSIYAEAIRQIRQTNPHRPVFVGPGKWNQVSELANLLLPDDDQNLIVTVHCYEPFYFTHQGATWSGPDTKVTGIIFPGPPQTPLAPDSSLNLRPHVLGWIKRYNTLPTELNPSSPQAFRSAIQQARDWSEYYGRPVHVGEFGCYELADVRSRARFYQAFRATLDEFHLGWAVWDWKAGFKYWDGAKNQPASGMREALFSK